MDTCNTCEHWYPDDQTQLHKNHRDAGRGICLKTTMVESQAGVTYRDDAPGAAVAAVRVAAAFLPQMVWGQLETTGDFGCNQYEAKQ